MSDQALIDALRDRIADPETRAVVIGYAIVVEVVTPARTRPGSKRWRTPPKPVGASGSSCSTSPDHPTRT